MAGVSPSTQDSGDVRQRILDAGHRIMGGKGYSAVGLNEVLTAAAVPKGSFYHYFSSKDGFGEALLDSYFEEYLSELDKTLAQPGMTMAERLVDYWCQWQESESFFDGQGRCLAVKLGAEVADLSEAMRLALMRGTSAIVERLARAIEIGVGEKSLAIAEDPDRIAQSLYQLWLGASVMAKINRGTRAFETAMTTTRKMLDIRETSCGPSGPN